MAAVALPCFCAAQTPGSSDLWRVYLSAGANATRAKNWPEAETFYTAAIKQAEEDKLPPACLTIASYSLATIYWEQGNQELAKKTLNPLQPVLDPAELRPEIGGSVDALKGLGDFFYSEAEAEKKDAEDKKIDGDPRKKIDDDVSYKYLFSRRYYQWVFVIEQQFISSKTDHSPDLQTAAEDLGVASYMADDYPNAIVGLSELLQIVETSNDREKALSKGSLAYSLASKGTTAPSKNRVINVSLPAVCLLLGRSYNWTAEDILKAKPEEADRDFVQAESYLQRSLDDADFGKQSTELLAEVYQKHAGVLRDLKKRAEADALDLKAKRLKPQQPQK